MRKLRGLFEKLTILLVVLLAAALSACPSARVKADTPTEYERYVHTYLNSGPLGNWTYLEKPGFPVLINDSQIPIGENWSIVCPLTANITYHVYLYGQYINNGSEPKTDYDVYVYNSLGEMEGYHTEAAGLPQHLGNTVDVPFFSPKHTGNYTFVLSNDARESKAAEEATFMIIQDVETNVWLQHYAEGKDSNSLPVLDTSWGYEFYTESQLVQLYIKVPKTLDMYEARLYLMSDEESENRTVLTGVPLAWEPGLYGTISNGTNAIGGYNLESKQYRGNAYASCEYYGEDMFLSFTAPNPGLDLYHLVFIGEVGYGTIDYLVKTEFNNTRLDPVVVPGRVYPENATTISYASNSSVLQNATLRYSTDSWQSANTTNMEISNNTCTAIIPEQAAGTTIDYMVTATDELENKLSVNGTYVVKYASALNLSTPLEVQIGDNVTVVGFLIPRTESLPVTVYASFGNKTIEITCYTLSDGNFTASFKPDALGTWAVYAVFNGTSSIFDAESPLITVQVQEPAYSKYSLYILGGATAALAIGVWLIVRKSRA